MLAKESLTTLRDLYFIASRLGDTSFSQYTFVQLTALDVLTAYPEQCEVFIRHIAPNPSAQMPSHPLDRTAHLYFMNTAEHFALVLAPQTCEELLVPVALPYLGAGADLRLRDLSEAAHSIMLSIFSSPRCLNLAGRYIPIYVEALFSVRQP